MSCAVFDASVLVKLVVEEAGTADARSRFEASETPVAPDWCMLECAQALWKKADRGEYPPEVVRESLDILQRIDLRLMESTDLVEIAFDIAIAHRHPVYDCAYIALAQAENVPLVTADRRLREVAQATGIEVLWVDSAT